MPVLLLFMAVARRHVSVVIFWVLGLDSVGFSVFSGGGREGERKKREVAC